MKRLFQYAVILHEYKVSDANATAKEYVNSKMIIEPKYLLAKDEKEVLFKVTREIPEEFATDPENVQILVRNF